MKGDKIMDKYYEGFIKLGLKEFDKSTKLTPEEQGNAIQKCTLLKESNVAYSNHTTMN